MINPRKISMAGTRAGDTISDGIESSAHSLICVPYISPLPSNVPLFDCHRCWVVKNHHVRFCCQECSTLLHFLALCGGRFLSTRSGNIRMGTSGHHTLMGR